MTQLPEFSYDRICPKCTSDTIGTEYRPTQPNLHWGPDGERIDTYTNGYPGIISGNECLLRTCHTCNWAWLEQCADTPSPNG